MLASGSGLLKKCWLSSGRSGGAFQIGVRAHNQRRSLEMKAGSWLLVMRMSMHLHVIHGLCKHRYTMLMC